MPDRWRLLRAARNLMSAEQLRRTERFRRGCERPDGVRKKRLRLRGRIFLLL